MNAGVAAARGPFGFLLQTTTGQYVVLGLGAFTVFPDKCEELLRPILRSLILGFPNVPLPNGVAGMANGAANLVAPPQSQSQAPIVIQTSNSSSSATEKIWGQVVTYTVSAAGVWVSYTIMVNYLPDWAKEMLPVTRAVFDKAVTNLGKGILCCSEQIMTLIRKQDETHGELMEAREDLHNVQSAVGRCEDALDKADSLNQKSAKGIKLLVRAVATMVPGTLNIADELNLYAKEIDIDPNERGEYLNAQKKNSSSRDMYHPGSEAYTHTNTNTVAVTEDSKYGKIISPMGPRTPMTRSISEPDDISEISADGPKGKMIMDHHPHYNSNNNGSGGDVSYMSHMFSPASINTPGMSMSMSAKKGMLPSSTMNMQKRIESLLNHGNIVM